MISLIPSSPRKKGIAEEEALAMRMVEKSKEFAESEAEVYVPA